ncbi:putative nucleotidyltransferase with HDIG domain [Rhizobium leguminosarum]|uniref:Nucleotidyltransferase with HDIG domain n=1 Tax=Rhizobium leguminosarum TaxID=384 RepID=A0AAE2SWU5_RHILE|nr:MULTISPECIES: HD-GYP domain-containing protein [Rhizobium]MBB4291102.1 putative nucleotidyltransferase with HDIG domain [Rhizobium leguminosarum]MBB4297802.1 putative nucleotidyltransferase with HDIG domain [Rhizobium leguminosarum]MBB4308941.1 putative nucleotidyltransferase with HDIG domain [Rhizobium leguminosarum]MBB4416777.1 putative nucleotidyltransferase with HDIG domain [Rhizobium leguminosarum]MBB4430254.1 putative nucleotidyltransferase with HDIG domain [Rhizobium esperanzae]
MLKRIDASQVRIGMFVEAIEGLWQDPLLSKRRFSVRRELDAAKIRKCATAVVVINTSKGFDTNGLPGRDIEIDSKAARETVQKSVQMLEEVFGRVQNGEGITFEQVAPVISSVSKSMDESPSVFLSVTRLKSKDEVTFLHSISVSALMILFSRHLGLDETTVQMLGTAGLLHDVGKLEIPLEVLTKEGRLEEDEIILMRRHPEQGHAILLRQEGMSDIVLDVCLNHHERIDGKGYPHGLSGSAVSLYARIATICDVYDAVTSVRPYKAPWSAGDALKWMLGVEGHFDRRLLKKFALCLSVASVT